MEVRCLKGHFLAEVVRGEAFELRVPCLRCKSSYVIKLKEGRIMAGLVQPPDGKLTRIPVGVTLLTDLGYDAKTEREKTAGEVPSSAVGA